MTVKDQILDLNLTVESFRVLFLLDRDGVEGLYTFVERTERIYKQFILKKMYWSTARRGFISSYLELRLVRKLLTIREDVKHG